MLTLEALNKKIRTAQDLLSVVKTMKSLAAVNIRQFEKAVESLEAYRRVVDLGWQALFRAGAALSGKARGGKAVCLVIGSDQGMCGQFNEVLLSRAQQEAAGIERQGQALRFWSAGEKVRAALEDLGTPTPVHFRLPGSLAGVNAGVQEVLRRIEAERAGEGLEVFHLCHNAPASQGGYAPVFQRLMPLDEHWARIYREEKWPSRCLPLLTLPPDRLFSHLLGQYLFVAFYRAFAQSLASENAARLMAMQAAENNILEMGEGLQALFREQRQAAITSELLDIISGFEALSGKPDAV